MWPKLRLANQNFEHVDHVQARPRSPNGEAVRRACFLMLLALFGIGRGTIDATRLAWSVGGSADRQPGVEGGPTEASACDRWNYDGAPATEPYRQLYCCPRHAA